MRLFDPAGWPRVFVVTTAGTLFCIAVALFVDSFNFSSLSEAELRRAILVNVAVPTALAGPLLFLLMWKMKQLAQAHRELQIIAATDGLTSVLNRGAFTMLVETYLERAEAAARIRSGALLVVDVDHFKTINDTFGHHIGDRALKLIAHAIKKATRSGDLVGRLGGEEFGIFLPGANEEQAVDVAERIRRGIAATEFAPLEKSHSLSVSVGGATFAENTTFERLYVVADEQLYVAKKEGRNRVKLAELAATSFSEHSSRAVG